MYMCKIAMLNVVLQNTITARLVVDHQLGDLQVLVLYVPHMHVLPFFGSSLSMYWLQKMHSVTNKNIGPPINVKRKIGKEVQLKNF